MLKLLSKLTIIKHDYRKAIFVLNELYYIFAVYYL